MLKKWWQKNNKKLAPFQFLLPFMIIYVIFRVYPIIYALMLGFHKWQGIGPWEYVGFDNYAKIFSDPVILTAFKNTLIMGVGGLLVSLPIALGFALLINNKKLIGQNFFRTIYFLPRVIAIAITAIIFTNIFHTEYGVVNYILQKIGITKEVIPWWQDAFWAKIGIIMLRSWMGIPFMMIYFLTGLQSIPQQVYEAAKIEGANRLHIFFYITLPLLKPITLFVLITGTIGAFQIFTAPYIITSGGPSNATFSIVHYMYSRGLYNLKFGLSSAVSTVLFISLALVALLEFKVGSDGYFEGGK